MLFPLHLFAFWIRIILLLLFVVAVFRCVFAFLVFGKTLRDSLSGFLKYKFVIRMRSLGELR